MIVLALLAVAWVPLSLGVARLIGEGMRLADRQDEITVERSHVSVI